MVPSPGEVMAKSINRTTHVLLLCCLVVFGLAGCATLGPDVLPEEDALPAADTNFWHHIVNAHPGDWYHVLNRGEDALEWRLRAIDSATDSVDMETFLWKPDRSGLQVLAGLLAAADRGVRVRVMLDDSFTMHEDLALHAIDEHPNIECRIYNPYRHRRDNVLLRQLFNLGDFSRVNHRMHNKALVVDGQAAIIGGRNIGDEYFGYDEAFNFRDMEVLTVGAGVQEVVRHFNKYWNSGWAFPVHQIIKPQDGAPICMPCVAIWPLIRYRLYRSIRSPWRPSGSPSLVTLIPETRYFFPIHQPTRIRLPRRRNQTSWQPH